MPDPVFIVLAAMLVIAAMLIIVVPLMRRGDSSPLTAGVVIAYVPLTAALLYFFLSTWDWDVTPLQAQIAHTEQTGSVAEVVTRLEQKMQDNPDDAEGWQMLGRSYSVLSRYPDAVGAYARARELTADQDVHALTGYAEALAMVRGGAIDQEVATLFEKALVLAPDDRKGLWYGGLAAFEQGRAELARSRWQRLIELGAPEEMAVILREQIAAANAALGQSPERTIDVATPENDPAGLQLRVSIAPELADRVHPDAPLFILARQAGVAGPPLAVVRRRVADLPLELMLTDADSMAPGRVLSAHENVEVVARIALGGSPAAQTGDLSGSKMVASNGNTAIVIDSVVQN